MLPSKKRFSRAQFSQFLLNKGVLVVYNRLGTLKYLPCDTVRFAVVTSSKHEKKAVVRNKLRRRVYVVVKASNVSLQGILYTSKQGYTLEYTEIKNLLNDLLTKAQKNPKYS